MPSCRSATAAFARTTSCFSFCTRLARLAAVDARLEKMDYAAIRQLQADVAVHALDADSAAGPVREVILEIVGLAYERLQNSAPDCAECVLPLLERAQRGVCPADEMLQIAAERGVPAALETVRL